MHTFTKAYINQVGICPTLKGEMDRSEFSYIDDVLLYEVIRYSNFMQLLIMQILKSTQ